MKKKPKLSTALLWVMSYLIILDIAINLIFPYPRDPRNISPSALRQFFEYGRSVEGKLARKTRKTDEGSARILSTGWLQDPRIRYFSNDQQAVGKPVITVYGMSHSVQLAEEMAKADDSFVVRSFGAPGAVPSWSYAAYLSDRERQHSDVVVLGIMTRGVPLICTTSGTTNHFDSVWPYTYPRFFEKNGTLLQIPPPFTSLAGYRDYFYKPEKWDSYVKWLNRYDKFYDPILYRETILDKSSLLRLLRRGYAYSSRSKKEAKVYDESRGFNEASEEITILRLMVEQFAEEAKKDGSLAAIYIVNNVFMSDHLYRILKPTLSSHNIIFLSTHELCPPNDPRNYLPDSHFIPSKNMELARAMLQIIKDKMPKKGLVSGE